MTYIPYGRQLISQADVDMVMETLQSDWLTQGPMIEQFEQAVAQYCGAQYAVAVNSATSALHIACLAAGLGKGDCLWTSPNTFVASANCALYCGAKVDFVDIDPYTFNMDMAELEIKLQHAKSKGNMPKVVVPVHFAGQSCDMARLGNLAKQFDFTVIEDAAHAIGGLYDQKKIGCCQFSDMTVFSFHPVKIVTTGEGGMVVTNRKDLYDKLLLLRSHGITRDQQYMEDKSQGPWYYEQIAMGYNYRLTDIQAALGVSQMKRIDEFIARRHYIAEQYDKMLAQLPVTRPRRDAKAFSAFHLYVIRINSKEITKNRYEIFAKLRKNGVGVNVHYIPVHTQPYYRKMGFKADDFPVALSYYQEAISLPIYPALTENEQKYVVQMLLECIK